MLEEIRELYDYNRWANNRFLDATAPLTDEEFTRDLRSSFASIQLTLDHILAAEWIWLQRWEGVSPSDLPADWSLTTYPVLLARWHDVEAQQRRFLDGLTDNALRAVVRYRNMAGIAYANPLWQLLRHVVNHSTYHRGQVATMLRQLGKPVPVSDLIAFFRERA